MSRRVTGVERDRSLLRGAALRIIRMILERPVFDRVGRGEMRNDWLAPPPVSAFQRLEPMGFGLDQPDWWIFNPDDCTPDLVWPLNVGFAATADDEPDFLVLHLHRTVTAKQVRGIAHRISPYMVRSDHAQDERGQLMCVAGIHAWLGGQWVNADKRVIWRGSVPDRTEISARDCRGPAIGTAIALRQRYEWGVSLGLENSPSVRFDTDPTGIKEIFRIRDLPEGRDRRAALMHWIGEHWRQDRFDPDLEIYVRKHLRGSTAFTWRGMNCELLPSQYDVEQRDKAIAAREAMREAGEHKRERGRDGEADR